MQPDRLPESPALLWFSEDMPAFFTSAWSFTAVTGWKGVCRSIAPGQRPLQTDWLG